MTAGGWVIKFTPEIMPSAPEYEIYHGAVTGPGGYFLVFLGTSLYGIGRNGSLNEYAPKIPMFVRKGQNVELHWSISTGTAPRCTFYFREPEVGLLT